MEHSFNIEHAKKYGLEEAILIGNMRHWITKNKANRKHIYDGRVWTYNSHKAFVEIYPYWNEHKIRRILDSLVEQEVLVKGNYNKMSYDRTTWYAFKDESMFLQNSQIELADLPNGSDEIARPIPVINTIINTVNKHINISFGEWWDLYDKKVGDKIKLEKKWNALSNEERQKAIDHTVLYKHSQLDKKFRKNPETYLNNKSFNDEIITDTKIEFIHPSQKPPKLKFK
jgi:hypothetical protein